MSFLDPVYPAFVAAVLAVYWLLPGARAKNVALIVASAVFYGWLEPRMLLVLLGSVLLDYVLALGISRWPDRSRLLVAVSVVTHVLALGMFKYLDWGLQSAGAAARALGVELDLPTVHLLLPLGLSFYSFQTLGYVIDVHRGRVRARRDLVGYLAFAMLFPQLVAGPIGRARRLFPQLDRDRRFSLELLRSGLTLALWGAFAKVVVADTIAPWTEAVLLLPEPPGKVLWASAVAFGVQIYADLLGYTCLARGTARMLGIELVPNLREPLLATSTPDFWRRWHLSFTSWVRDYLLAPLLTAFSGRPAIPLLVTFLVLGMWHGAGWHYAAFGMWHAAWVGIYLWLEPRVPPGLAAVPGARVAAILVHVTLVLLPGTVIFNAGSLTRAIQLLATPPWHGDADAGVVAGVVLVLAAAGGGVLAAEWALRKLAGEAWARIGTAAEGAWVLPAQTTACSLGVVALLVFHRIGARDFVYFRF